MHHLGCASGPGMTITLLKSLFECEKKWNAGAWVLRCRSLTVMATAHLLLNLRHTHEAPCNPPGPSQPHNVWHRCGS